MNWKNDSNHSTIAALDKAIEICAKRNELSSVHEKICKMGKAEISACVDPSRYIIPSRWCDKAEVKKCGEIPHNYIEQYLQAGIWIIMIDKRSLKNVRQCVMIERLIILA